MSDAVAGAFVAGIIGVATALLAAAVSVLFAFQNDHYRRSLAAHGEYLSWLRGLIPESEFLISCLDELEPLFKNGSNVVPTKRLNSDFLAAARLGIMKHPRGAVLFPHLTAAYRDVVHTNDMMSRFEWLSHQLESSRTAKFEFPHLKASTAACFPAVRASVESFLAVAKEQEGLETDHAPTFWNLDQRS